MYISGEPAFQAFGKVTDGLGECARDWPQDIGDEKIHYALVEDVVASVEVVDDRLTAS